MFRALNFYQGGRTESALMIVFPNSALADTIAVIWFAQRLITEESEMALMMLLNNTRQLDIVSIVGMPLGVNATLINAAVVIQKGKIPGAAQDLPAQLQRILRAALVHLGCPTG